MDKKTGAYTPSPWGRPPAAKEPWQMTREEYVKPPYTSPAMHKYGVQKALSEGKPVPAEVLKDYPDLAQKAIPAAKEVTKGEAGRLEVEQSLERVNKRIEELRTSLKSRTVKRETKIWQNNELARYNEQKAGYERLLRENDPAELSRYAPKEVSISGMPLPHRGGSDA